MHSVKRGIRRIGPVPDVAKVSEPRERLLRAATRLFYEEGIHGIGVDRVLAEAGVTRATMYRHFPGKEALVVAYLEHEDEVIRGLFAAAAEAAGDAGPRELLALVIDGVAEDATRLHTRGCPFINASAYDEKSLIAQTTIHLAFLVSAIAIAYCDRIITQTSQQSNGH